MQAVLFDWGETLTHSDWDDEIALAANWAGLAAVGRDGLPPPEAIGAWFRAHRDELFPEDSLDEVDLVATHRRLFRDLDAGLTHDEVDRYIDASYRYWASSSKVVQPGILELLEELRARGLRLGMASNTWTPRRLLDPVLEAQG